MRSALSIGCGLLLVFSQVSCSSTSTVRSGANADTYSVSGRSSDSVGGLLIAQNQALEKAEQFCLGQGRRFHQMQDDARNDGDQSQYVVQFRCLASDDPRVQHPAVNRSPFEDGRF